MLSWRDCWAAAACPAQVVCALLNSTFSIEDQKVDCPFCSIVAGQAPATFVFQDEHCAAFMDIQPVNPGHVLIVPVRHATSLADLSAAAAGHLMQVAHGIAGALRHSGLRCDGVNLLLADGEAAMQEVFHVHLHVFPRFPGDGFGLRFDPEYSRRPSREQLEHAAGQIRSALGTVPPASANTLGEPGRGPRIDADKLEEVALALLGMTSFTDHGAVRVWKGLDWDLLDSLCARGWITNPKNKAKSVVLTQEGQRLAPEFFRRHFAR